MDQFADNAKKSLVQKEIQYMGCDLFFITLVSQIDPSSLYTRHTDTVTHFSKRAGGLIFTECIFWRGIENTSKV